MPQFSERHGLDVPDAEITIRHDAPAWLRDTLIAFAYEAKFQPSQLRAMLCKKLMVSPDLSNWSEFPNVDGEVHDLVAQAPWFFVYDLIEELAKHLSGQSPGYGSVGYFLKESFEANINRLFTKKGVGWQLTEGEIQVRGPEIFEQTVHTAVELAVKSGRTVARHELAESLRDLSRRPDPDLSGATHHALAALECIARDFTNEPSLTLGEWLKKHPATFPPPLGEAAHKLWGYASGMGRHVQESRPPTYDEAELLVGVAGALSIYLLRKLPAAPPLGWGKP